jgi:peptide/nickel transport system substrate-binding protein
MRRGIAAVLAVALCTAACTAAAGCSQPVDDGNPGKSRPDTLVVAGKTPEGRFLPIYASSLYDSEISQMVFEGLLINDPEAKPVPWLAEKWEISPDGLTYTFHLRHGVKFTNGEELTAKDVVFTYTLMADPAFDGAKRSAISTLYGFDEYNMGGAAVFAGVAAPDDYTVVFRLSQARASAIWDFGYGIMSKDYYGPYTKGDLTGIRARMTDCMGCGPYELAEYAPGDSARFTANPVYWGGKPKIPVVSYRFVDDDAARRADVEKGLVDIAKLGADDGTIEMVENAGFYRKYLFAGLDYTHIGFNVRSAPLDDKRVRRALMVGFDREAFLEKRYGAFGFTLDIPFSRASWAFDKTIPAVGYDPAEAERLLDEAGWTMGAGGLRENPEGEPLSIRFSCWGGTVFAVLLVEQVKDDWEKIGVKVEVEQMDSAELANKVFDERDFQCYAMGWSLSIDPDPTDLYGSAATAPGGFNPGGWSTPESDALLASGLATSDQAARAQIYSDWSKLFLDEMPCIIIGSSDQFFAVNERVKGIELGTYRTWQYMLHKAELAK